LLGALRFGVFALVDERLSLLDESAVVLVFEERQLGGMELGFRHQIFLDEAL
jgi:hypothetical protein